MVNSSVSLRPSYMTSITAQPSPIFINLFYCTQVYSIHFLRLLSVKTKEEKTKPMYTTLYNFIEQVVRREIARIEVSYS